MSSEPLELAGLLLACGAAAAAVLLPQARWQPLAIGAALALAPVVILGDVWGEPRVVDLRESPSTVALVVALGLGAIAAGALIIRRWAWAFPVLAFAAIALRLPVRIGEETSTLLIPLYLVIAAGLAATLWERARGLPGTPEREDPETAAVVWLRRLLAASLVLYAVQTVYSEDVSNAVENACFFLVPFSVLFCQLAALRWTPQMLFAACVSIAAVGACLTAVAIGEFAVRDLIFNKDLLDSNQIKPLFRVNSLFHDPNVLGRYLAVGVIALGAAIAWSRGGPKALAVTAAGLLMLVGLVLSFSITSVAALLAGLAVVATLRYGVRGGLAGAAAILLTGVVFAFSGGADRTDVGPVRGIGEETSGRTDLLRGGYRLIKREPVTGWGSGAFGRVFYDEIRQTETTTSHSEPITVAAEQGILGFALYLALLGAMAWALFGDGVRSSGARAAAAGGVVALVVHSMGYAGFMTDPATWALLGLAVALRAPPTRH